MKRENASNCCAGSGCESSLNRREFVKLGTSGAALVAARSWPAMAGPFTAADTSDHFVPLDKKLQPAWIEALFAKGERTWYAGDDLKTIGMPIGGIAAGQVYLSGDGRLIYWGIYNQYLNSGYGAVNYKVGREPTEMVVNTSQFAAAPEIDQGFAIHVRDGDRSIVRRLDREGFSGSGVRFCGEYPLAFVEYRAEDVPVDVDLEAFSPFIPLNEKDSSLPATVLHYTLQNRTDRDVEVTLAGWLQNAILHVHQDAFAGRAVRDNRVLKQPGRSQLVCSVRASEQPTTPQREPIVLADFDGADYGDWKIEGDAFGEKPASGTLPSQQEVSGFRGEGLVNTYLGGNDQKQGKLTSPTFQIERPFLCFLIGGGASEKGTCMNLLVNGQVVRSATGKNAERLTIQNWDVREFEGKDAQLQIVDAESGGWGHINVDQIELRDTPLVDGADTALDAQPDFGTMCLTVMTEGKISSRAALPETPLLELLQANDAFPGDNTAEGTLKQNLTGALTSTVEIPAGQSRTVTFVLAWHMPNLYNGGRLVGQQYGNWFSDATAVADYVAEQIDRLTRETRLWHDTYYDSTLPYWLLDRLHSTLANLATETCQWWKNGRFWAYEGCGCCHGTCGHVWNYEHAMARLFPRLERSVREMQDFAEGVGFIAETGEIRFRGENWGLWAGDSQGGYILKAYREHQISSDDQFLRRNWPQIRKAVDFLIVQDANADGLIEGRQHQTYDQDYYGANTMVGSLYLGALRAAEAMARELGEDEYARKCRQIADAGQQNSVQRLYNGEYYIQDVDLEKHPKYQYADGCLADQMFGQGWAHQVALGYIYPRDTVLRSLESVWKYCWAPDVRRQNEAHAPQRWFAYPGEAGLFTCTWPKSEHLGPDSTVYRDEVWTGIEYQVAGHMAYEGMLTEALAMCRAVHERYHPSKRNPFNEIECGDHYARALASWGVLISLSGFHCHGPHAALGFAPRMAPEAFQSVFTSPEAWGTLQQRREEKQQVNRIQVKWGRLPLKTLSLELAADQPVRQLRRVGSDAPVKFQQDGRQVLIELPDGFEIQAGDALEIAMEL